MHVGCGACPALELCRGLPACPLLVTCMLRRRVLRRRGLCRCGRRRPRAHGCSASRGRPTDRPTDGVCPFAALPTPLRHSAAGGQEQRPVDGKPDVLQAGAQGQLVLQVHVTPPPCAAAPPPPPAALFLLQIPLTPFVDCPTQHYLTAPLPPISLASCRAPLPPAALCCERQTLQTFTAGRSVGGRQASAGQRQAVSRQAGSGCTGKAGEASLGHRRHSTGGQPAERMRGSRGRCPWLLPRRASSASSLLALLT